ncbi:MAG TPA: hypothetical protein VMD30_10830 [Tepidisphaeraceae bacterium]|nr:hypothetical protein [Tepidisphaeraceae bacterium]
MVMVDQQPLATTDLGLETVGEVFSHLARANRLVVHFLIDGQTPNLEQLPALRQARIDGHTLFIETADPRQMAKNVLKEAHDELAGADAAKDAAAEQLRRNNFSSGMEKLATCLAAWQRAEQAIVGSAKLLNINLDAVLTEAALPPNWLTVFAENLRQLGLAVQARDAVALTDLLAYETTQTTSHWQDIVAAMLAMV